MAWRSRRSHGLSATRHAIADYLESERPGDTGQHSEALFLAASSVSARRPGGRLSPRSVNTIVAGIGRLHDAETADRERQLGVLRPHDYADVRVMPTRPRTSCSSGVKAWKLSA